MNKCIGNADSNQENNEVKLALEEVLRVGARKMLEAMINNEVAEFIDNHRNIVDDQGHRIVVRNGYMPERELITGIGRIKVCQPRVRNRQPGYKFTSRILPPFMRRVPSVDALIPCLYLKGISTGDFSEALESILGAQAAGLSATNIVRLKETWKKEYDEWRQRDLSGKHYVYIWADGIHFNVRLDDERSCMLVIIGATPDGHKELLAVHEGFRESKLSWLEVLRDLKQRGLKQPPALAVGDGALGFWAAAEEEFPKMRRQRCWVHKTANILDKMPKSMQGNAKQSIYDMYMAGTKNDALKAFRHFLDIYKAKFPKACDCLEKDQDDLFTFYDFPAEHWVHIRTTNPIESTFATVRLRTTRTKGCGSRIATLTMVFKLALEAEKHWRRLNKHEFIPMIMQGVKFVDGVLAQAA